MNFVFGRTVLNLVLGDINIASQKLKKHSLNVCCRKQYCSASVAKEKTKKTKEDIEDTKEKNRKRRQIVYNYMSSSSEFKDVLPLVPKNYLKISRTSPPSLYLVSDSTAKRVVECIVDKLNKKCSIIEINPGFGCLTKNLLESGKVQSLTLYETSSHFDDSIEELQKQYPNKIDYRKNDFFAIYKYIFQDSFDNGNRLETLLSGLNLDVESEDVNLQIIGSMSSTMFLRSSIYAMIFNEGALGRPELFVLVQPSAFYTLVPNDSINSTLNSNSISTLFQLLFDYTILGSFPREHFLPWQVDLSTNLKKNTLKKKVLQMDLDHLLLVNIKLKKKSPCDSHNLSLLWFFLKQHCRNRKLRVIPSLENWIPGCGIWLITSQDPPDTDPSLAPDDSDAPLPHMTIFTRFHDLTAEQKLTLFKRFISWPEFKNSPFTEEMYSYRTKMLSNTSSNVKYDTLFEHEDMEGEE